MTLSCCPRSTCRRAAVRLVQGAAGLRDVYGDPLEAALAWQRGGAEWIHLVDLDAAFGRGDNRELLAEVVGRLDVAVELSGGIRDDESLRGGAGHRLRAGEPRHRRAGVAGLGARRRSPSTATGSRSGSTSAARRWPRAAGRRTAATCTRRWPGWTPTAAPATSSPTCTATAP